MSRWSAVDPLHEKGGKERCRVEKKTKNAAVIIRLAAQCDMWIPLRVKLQEKAHERTFCPITPYVTPVTLPPNLLPRISPWISSSPSPTVTLTWVGRKEGSLSFMLSSYPFISSCCFPLISCREWLPRHVPKGSTSKESSWRSLSAGSRFTVKDQGWVACRRAGPWQSCAARPLPAAVLWTYSIGHPEGRRSHGSVHNVCQGRHLVSLAGTVDILVWLQYLHRGEMLHRVMLKSSVPFSSLRWQKIHSKRSNNELSTRQFAL